MDCWIKLTIFIPGPANLLKLSQLDPQYLYTILSSNKSRFKSGSEFKRSTFWGLRTMAPPLPASLASTLTSSMTSHANGSHAFDAPPPSFNKISKRKVQPQLSGIQSGAVRKTAAAASLKKDQFQRNPSVRGSKQRGRPPRFKKPRDSFDSCSDASSGSWGSLDLFIPPPSDFEGFNNPFRDVDNCLRLVQKSSDKNVIKVRNGKSGLFEEEEEPILKPSISSIFSGNNESKASPDFSTCARRLTWDGHVQYLIERDVPQGPISPTVD